MSFSPILTQVKYDVFYHSENSSVFLRDKEVMDEDKETEI